MKASKNEDLHYRESAPLAPHPGEALRRPARLPALGALGVARQVALLKKKRDRKKRDNGDVYFSKWFF